MSLETRLTPFLVLPFFGFLHFHQSYQSFPAGKPVEKALVSFPTVTAKSHFVKVPPTGSCVPLNSSLDLGKFSAFTGRWVVHSVAGRGVIRG